MAWADENREGLGYDPVEDYHIAIRERIKHGIWVNSQGERLEIKSMDTLYIQNVLRFIERQSDDILYGYIKLFKDVLAERERKHTYQYTFTLKRRITECFQCPLCHERGQDGTEPCAMQCAISPFYISRDGSGKPENCPLETKLIKGEHIDD